MGRKYGSAVDVPKVASTPASPSAGYVSIYAKSDDKVYSLTSGGTETDLTATGGGGGGGMLATPVVRTAATISTYTIASATNADVDATNLAITFTAPATGNVLVRLIGTLDTNASSAAKRTFWSLRTGTTNVAGSERFMRLGATPPIAQHLSADIHLTGLTPGNSYTYKWAWRTTTATTATLYYGSGTSTAAEFGSAGTNNGALIMEVWSA